MIHYHGTPITPAHVASDILQAKHAFISYEHKGQIDLVLEVCQSFALDNGAFSRWIHKKPAQDWTGFYDWVDTLKNAPGFDFAVIPDVIDGDEVQNDSLIAEWPHEKHLSAPVWHMHESIERFYDLCHQWPRVCIGSSGAFATVGTIPWWLRMNAALVEVVDDRGFPPCKLHGLRMLNPKIFACLPLSSADSTNIARNIGIDQKWKGTYQPPDKAWRAKVMCARIESVNGAQSYGSKNI